MKIQGDLHSHSAFAGGARGGGKSKIEREKKIIKRFHDISLFSPLKGVELLGTGDIQFEWWNTFVKKNFIEDRGFFEYNLEKNIPKSEIVPNRHEYNLPKFVLQSEFIFTSSVKNTKYRKKNHILILFPNFNSVDDLIKIFDSWGVKHKNMARPFIKCEGSEDVANKLFQIKDINSYIEIIPAHIMTPEGIYGGRERINFMSDFFGDYTKEINAVETGLSADPNILGLIPELDDIALISNADAHSSNLNRIGREFTTYNLKNFDYQSLINSIRKNKIIQTTEFNPAEGKYFLTGHRESRGRPNLHLKGQYCIFSPKHVPKNDLCPQCGKELTIGVLQRAYEISNVQGKNRELGDGPRRKFLTMIPLVEIIAKSLKMKSLTSKRVLIEYRNILEIIKNEVNLWTDIQSLGLIENSKINPDIVNNIKNVIDGNFKFDPPGYDGVYGNLKFGDKLDVSEINLISN